MFAERLGQILSVIEASPTEIARYMEIDPSNISRMLTGKRLPKNSGEAAWRLVSGIFSYADENGKTAELCALIACENADSADTIKGQMMSWLYEGVDDTPKKLEPPKDRVPYRAFGEKLNAVMELAELSNIRFGKLINVDTSYISRFRNGLRSPKSNPKTMNAICSVLLDRLYEQDKIRQLGALMNTSPEVLKDEDEALTLFHNWLFDTDKEDSGSIVEKLLENIDAFSLETKIPLPSFEEAADEKILMANETAYFGTGGLQTAVIRFLGNAINHNAKELCLYSDQDMDWMVGDPAFRMKWSALMLECVKHGIHIRIIHNIDRDLHEMIDAITSWLPLYMSGMIESYYCKKQKNTRFSNTLFLCPGIACVEGSNVNGQEEQNGIYHYYTDAAMLEAYKQSFDGLLADSKQLVRIYSNFDSERTTLMGGSGMTVLGTTLPLTTMPENTLLSILDRSGADKEMKESVFDIWNNRKSLLTDNLKGGFVHECIPTAKDEQLFAGVIAVDIPGAAQSYTPQEYAEHIRNIIALSDEHVNYRFYELPDAPFQNTQIVITENAIAVIKLNAPQVTFMISHPAMREAFSEYANRIKEQYNQDKITTKRMLERYL